MRKLEISILIVVVGGGFYACTTEEQQIIPPVEERVDEAVNELKSELLVPENGWRVLYKPNPIAGSFLVLLEFDEDGNVRIQSDLPYDDGEYYDQTVPYRVDVGLDVELIFETYGFFAFLFEQYQSTLGGEFEFEFVEKDGDNLIFESKSDQGNKTRIVFEPAGPNDDDDFSRDIAQNLMKFDGYSPVLFGPLPTFQHLLLEDKNISIYWEFDALSRTVGIALVGEGSNIEEVTINDNYIQVLHISGFTLADNKMIFSTPFAFNITGEEITIDEISLGQFSFDGPPLCPLEAEGTPQYTGQISGVGNIKLTTSLVSSSGFGFTEDNVFTVNAFFVFDSLGNSLQEDGIIADYYPDASGFAFFYGADLINDTIPIYSTGLIDEEGELLLRAYDSTVTYGNKVNVGFQNEFYFSGDEAPEDEQQMTEITDEIYYGGVIYAYDFEVPGIVVYRLYNPCNKYEFALVQN